MAKVFIGVDPHKLSATIEVFDDRETRLATARFSTDTAGYAAMRRHVRAWPERVWAVEGSNGAGHPLAPRPLADGEHVVDVPAKLSAHSLLSAGTAGSTEKASLATANMRSGAFLAGRGAVGYEFDLAVETLLDRREWDVGTARSEPPMVESTTPLRMAGSGSVGNQASATDR